MRAFILAALACVASVAAQAVPEGIAPKGPSPPGCKQTVDGNFTIGIAVPAGARSRRESAIEAAGTALQCTLNDGILRDPYGRTGAVVANYQFQFDGPPQAGTIYTGGFSVCQNGSLALGSSAVWWRCMSGEFGNLYDRWIGAQCHEVLILASLTETPTPSSSSATPSSTPTESSTPSASSAESASSSATTALSESGSRNATSSTVVPSGSGSGSVSVTSAASSTAVIASPATSAGSNAGAYPTRVPRRETFGAVIGILGAALVL